MADYRISDKLTLLAACLGEQITAAGLPPTCYLGVVPGDVAVAEYGGDCEDKCGVAWVRMVTMYPAQGLGIPDETPQNCGSSLGMDLEVGILRCFEIPEDGSPPTAEQLLESTRFQTADSLAMWRAILCCDALPNKETMLTGYSPMGPLGGVVGGAWGLRTVL